MKQKVDGLQSIISKASEAKADVHVEPGDRIVFGSRSLEVRATPGHTAGCVSYVADDESFVLTGDALLIQGYVSYRYTSNYSLTIHEPYQSLIRLKQVWKN